MAGLNFNPDDFLPALSYPLTSGPEEHPLSSYPQVAASARLKYTGPGPSESARLGADYFTPQSGEELARLVAGEQANASRLGRNESYSMVGRRAAAGPVTEGQIKDFTTQKADHPEYGADNGNTEILNYIGQLEENYNKFSPENIVKMAIQKGIPAAKVPELVAHYSKFRTPVPDHLQKLKLAMTSDRAAEILGAGKKTGKDSELKPGQVSQRDREFRQYLGDYQSIANKLMKLENEGAGLLADPTKYEEQKTQLKAELQKYDNLLQTTSPDLYKQLMTGTPAAGATKTGEAKKLDKETAMTLFMEAGKDKEKARQLAKERGYTL